MEKSDAELNQNIAESDQDLGWYQRGDETMCQYLKIVSSIFTVNAAVTTHELIEQ